MKAEATSSLNLDARSLDSLRNEAARNPRGAARQAAVQFESLFMQQVVKSMRDATPKSESAGSGGETFTAMLDSQFAKQFAGRPGGLSDMLEKQLTQHMQNLPPVSPENAAAAASAAAAAATFAPAAPAQPAAGAPSAPVAAARPGARQAAFIEKMLPHAREAQRQTGVPASFIVGQAALESGWGKGEIRNADGSSSFNLFGVKAGAGWKGATTDQMTTEYEGAQPVRQRAAFRSYGSYAEAFADYAKLLSSSKRYGNVVRTASTAESFAGGLQRAGYATDPHYAQKLARTINHTLSFQRAGTVVA